MNELTYFLDYPLTYLYDFFLAAHIILLAQTDQTPGGMFDVKIAEVVLQCRMWQSRTRF